MEPTAAGGEILYDKIQELSPKNDTQRSLQAQALNMAIDLGKMRWLMFEQGGSFVSMPLLAMLVLWLRTIGFGCDLLDHGDVHAFPGTDADLQRSTAQRPWASRPVAGMNRNKLFETLHSKKSSGLFRCSRRNLLT